jgi:PhoH-like ATPase
MSSAVTATLNNRKEHPISRRTYVLDTSVLLAAGRRALTAFAANDIVVPLVVITELESKRNDPELGWLARQVLGALEQLRLTDADGLRTSRGVIVNDAGGTARIELNHVDQSGLPDALRRESSHDVRILAVAAGLARQALDDAQDDPVVPVSRDLPMRLLASAALGLTAQDYRNTDVAAVTAHESSAHRPADKSMSAFSSEKERPGHGAR